MQTATTDGRMTRRELAQWLCGPGGPASGDAFTLALLRDLLASDAAVRWWLDVPRAELGGHTAAEFLDAGEIDPVERLAIREWQVAARA